MNEENLNDISVVYDNDTIDFGTIDFSVPSDGKLAKKDDVTHIESDSDTGYDDKDHLPQHANTFTTTNRTDLYQQHISTIIDNRTLEYIPVRLKCGICAYCSPDVLKHCPMILRSIQADISNAFSVLPVSVHSLLRRTNLWLNYNGYAYGPKANPRILRHVTTHHHPAWLVEWACDTPQKAMGIEIYSCVDFQNMRLHWNGSGLLLHEYCHLIHQCCLEDGLENKTVATLYERADASGKYEKVLRRDWAGKTEEKLPMNESFRDVKEQQALEADKPADFDLAYAMVDPKEFFAELSVAYFCKSYRALDKADPNTMEACSPPLLHPDATKRIEYLVLQRECASSTNNLTMGNPQNYYRFIGGSEYHSVGNGDSVKDHSGIDCWAPFPPLERFVRSMQRQRLSFLAIGSQEDDEDVQLARWKRLIDRFFRERAASRNCATIGHCNKFYPFTRGQLRKHDPELFEDLGNVWREISMWEDPHASLRTKKRMSRSCSRRFPGLYFSDCC